MRLHVGRALARLATWIAGDCPCERCARMRVNRVFLAAAPRHQRRQMARDVLRQGTRGGGPAT